MSYASSIYTPPEAPKFDAPPGTAASWQGYSVAMWTTMGGDRENYERSGSLKVVTSRLKPGYYWRNGMPYTETRSPHRTFPYSEVTRRRALDYSRANRR